MRVGSSQRNTRMPRLATTNRRNALNDDLQNFSIRGKNPARVSNYSSDKARNRSIRAIGCANGKHGQATLQPQASDLELLRRSRRGDGRAFHALVDRYAKPMYGLAYSLLNNAADAEDVVQESFAGAFKALSKFEERSSVKTWLSRILVNQVAMLRRSRRNDAQPASLESAEASNVNVDARLDLQSTLQSLSDEHREVLVLRELQQLSYEEIADVLGVPRGTVESLLHRARAELRKKLGDYLSS